MKKNSIPSEKDCLLILKKHSTPPNVINHCLKVTSIAKRICKNLNIDENIVIAGAMLHDIGRSVTHSLHHAVEGAKILMEEGISPHIISIVKNHIGTGITKEECAKLKLPIDDYTPQTLEEIVVSYADNLTVGERERSFEETLNHFSLKFGKESTIVKGLYQQRENIEKSRKK